MGELAQLSGRPYLVDAVALTDVEAVAISPDQLRALLIAEAELGERIMRALILRRVGLIEAGAGPVIIGDEANADVLRLVNFLRRNGHPYQALDPETDRCGQTLIERFQVEPEELPIVLCPERQPAAQSVARISSRAASGWSGRSIRTSCTTSSSSAPGRRDWRPRSMPARKACRCWRIDCRSFGGQAGASARIENYLGFPTGISGMALMGRAFSQAQKFGVEIAIPDEAVKLECGNDPCHVALATGERIQARSVVIATGARYRRLGVDRPRGISRASRSITGPRRWKRTLPPAAMSLWSAAAIRAGQATVFLASRARRVTLVARRPLERDHVALSGRPDRKPAERRRGDRLRDCRARGIGRPVERGDRARAGDRDRRSGRTPATSSRSSAPSRTPTGCEARASRSISAASC